MEEGMGIMNGVNVGLVGVERASGEPGGGGDQCRAGMQATTLTNVRAKTR